MSSNKDEDLKRFDQKIKELQKEGLEKYFSNNHTTVPGPGGRSISIPIRSLHLPRFRFSDDEDKKGVGQGEGNIGDILPGMDEQETGAGQGHGSGRGWHRYQELNLEDAAEILGEQLELPNLLEKFAGDIGFTKSKKYSGIQPTGPESLRHTRRSFKRALLRTRASGKYDPQNPKIIITRPDKRYKAPKEFTTPITKAVLVYLMDRSRSMGGVLDFLQNVGFWAEAWIGKHYSYDNLERRYIQYDGAAEEVPRRDFYTIQAGGGTSMYMGLSFTRKMIRQDYPENKYNVYLLHYTDGDCMGIEMKKEDVEQYRQWADVFPGRSEIEESSLIEEGNPLTDFLIPRCSAIFVCEAGAFYGNYNFDEEVIMGNYSSFLGKLIHARPTVGRKVRYISHTEEEINEARGEKIKETLLHWFK